MENKTETINIAFFDAEYTARTADDRGMQEMIQCALLVCQLEISDDHKIVSFSAEPIYSFSSFVQPRYTPELSDYIMDLTSISQNDVEMGCSFSTAIDTFYDIINQYHVKKVLVWGPDLIILKRNCALQGIEPKKTRKLLARFKDVSLPLSQYAGYTKAISQHKMCEHLKVEEIGKEHDAYSDAFNLFQIARNLAGASSL